MLRVLHARDRSAEHVSRDSSGRSANAREASGGNWEHLEGEAIIRDLGKDGSPHAKAVNNELARRGHSARLEKASGYFCFFGGEAKDSLDRTVGVRTIDSLTLKQWIEEFRRLKAPNEQFETEVRHGGERYA